MPHKPNIKIGTRFGKLVVIKKARRLAKTKSSCYLCKCDCGRIRIIPRNCLISNKYKSCGCARIKYKPPGHSAKTRLYNICRLNALSRGIDFNITVDEHNKLISRNCYYCNSEPPPYNPYVTRDGKTRDRFKKTMKQSTIERAWIKANSIDRIDSKIGYVRKNCVSSCWNCNKMKVDFSLDMFLNQINAIFNFQKLRAQ